MKSKSSNRSIAQVWGDLFHANEQRVKEGKKPWTDAELMENMEAEFPASAGKSTLMRPRMYRTCWNVGTHFYSKTGGRNECNEWNGPESQQYNSKGDVVAKGSRGDPDKPKAEVVVKGSRGNSDKPKIEKPADELIPLSKLMKKNKEAKGSKVEKKVVRKAKPIRTVG